MKENDFLSIYRTWSDDELINAFSNRNDYQPPAVEAMIKVLKERRLEDKINLILDKERKIVEQYQAAECIDHEQLIKAYEIKSTGSDEDDVAYAQKQLEAKEIFYESVFTRYSKSYQWFKATSMFILVIGGTSFIMFCIGLFSPPLFENSQIIFGSGIIPFVLGLVFHINTFRNAKTICRLYKDQTDNIILELKHPKYSFTAQIPFSFSITFTYQTTQINTVSNAGVFRAKINNPVILLLLSNGQGETVLFKEILPSWVVLPRDVLSSELTEQMNNAKIFLPYPFKKPKLMVLKKLLAGLNTLTEPSLK